MSLLTPDLLRQLTRFPIAATSDPRIFSGLPALAARPVDSVRRLQIMSQVEEIIATRRFRVIGEQDDQAIWQKGWDDVAQSLKQAARVDLEALKPQYFHANVELRLLDNYWLPETDYFEYWLGAAVRRLLMLQLLGQPSKIVELGCGTGMNLVLAAELFPQASLVGSDWVKASINILDHMAQNLGRDICGVTYNMLTGDGGDDLPIDSETAVLTVHALEQLGAAAPAVIRMLMQKRPKVVLHIEPILDFYDRTNPFDDIAARYHLTRGYLQGLWPALSTLRDEGAIEVLASGRVPLGNLYHEAYSYIAWRPR